MDGLYGLIANGTSIILTHPIDVIKTNYQLNQTKPDLKSVTSIDITRNIWKTRGVKGFYAGVTPNLSTYPVFWAVYFGSNQMLNQHKLFSNEYANKFINAYVASALGSTVTNPLFVLKTRIQATNRENTTVIETIKSINKIGYKTYFRGLNSTLVNNTKLAIQFPMYDYIKDHTGSVVFSSFISKAISSSILYPLDLIRVNQRNSDVKVSIKEVAKTIHKEQGVRGLYKGVLLYNLVSTSNFVIMMVLFESLKKY